MIYSSISLYFSFKGSQTAFNHKWTKLIKKWPHACFLMILNWILRSINWKFVTCQDYTRAIGLWRSSIGNWNWNTVKFTRISPRCFIILKKSGLHFVEKQLSWKNSFWISDLCLLQIFWHGYLRIWFRRHILVEINQKLDKERCRLILEEINDQFSLQMYQTKCYQE